MLVYTSVGRRADRQAHKCFNLIACVQVHASAIVDACYVCYVSGRACEKVV